MGESELGTGARKLISLTTLAIVASSCSTESLEYAQLSQGSFEIDTTVPRHSEEPLLALARSEGSVGGYYCEEGDLVVVVARPLTPTDEIRFLELVDPQTLSACRVRANPTRVPSLVVRQKKYSFLALRSWRDALVDEFFEIDGAQAIGLDYRKNCLVLELKSETAADSVASLTASNSVPVDAYSVTVVPEDVPTSEYACANPSSGPEVVNCFRPVPGGVHMAAAPDLAPCTVGSANDRYWPQYGTWLPGWVTASHCVAPTWENQFRNVYQPTSTDNQIGYENYDPYGWPCGSYTCRWSDSAWVRGNYGLAQHGTIVQTNGWNGNRTVNTANPRFYVWGSRTAQQGMQIEKMGASTGWTTSTIEPAPCIDILFNNKVYKCQDRSPIEASFGDSGGPVFNWWWWNGSSTVELMGIVWGGSPGVHTNISPWHGIEKDLGTIYIQYPYF